MKRVFVVLAATAATTLGAAAPATAHPGHRGCDPGASVFAQTLQPFGQSVRVDAQDGGVNETVAVLHETGCQDAPG